MKRQLLFLLGLGVGGLLLWAGVAEWKRRTALARLAPFAEFNSWRYLGRARFEAKPYALLASPADVTFVKLPRDAAGVASQLQDLPGLETVRVNSHAGLLPRAFLAALRKTHITLLDLDSAELERGALEEMSGAPKLEVLILTGSNLRAFPRLVLPRLKDLSLSQTLVTEAGLAGVFDQVALESLDLSGCAISRLDPAQCARLSRLKLLRLGHTQITDSHAEALRKVLPHAEVAH